MEKFLWKFVKVITPMLLCALFYQCQTDTDEFDSLSSDKRCEAITKKGTRCKRRAQAKSHYCWQHQELEATYPND
jgi:hypothetical protein